MPRCSRSEASVLSTMALITKQPFHARGFSLPAGHTSCPLLHVNLQENEMSKPKFDKAPPSLRPYGDILKVPGGPPEPVDPGKAPSL